MATDDADGQLTLFSGFYRCDDCGALVDRLRRTRRFRLCDACYERVVPEVDTIEAREVGSAAHQAMTRYWEWFDEIDKRVPRRTEPGHRARTRQAPATARKADELFPLCDCGRPREATAFAWRDGGLFGGPFQQFCPVCAARQIVESAYRMGAKIHPDWDDETWLDHLYRVYPEAFALGVLPGYWYELRYPGITRRPAVEPEPVDPLARRPRRRAG